MTDAGRCLTAALTLHSDAGFVPEMRPDEWRAFVADVRERGIVEPLAVLGTVVLDGRHRLRAAKEAGLATVPVREVALNGDGARDYMLRAALLRRHLSDDQRAVIAAMFAREHPKPRGGDRRSEGAKADQTAPTGRRLIERKPAQRESAAVFGVSLKRVERAAALFSAAPELAEKVYTGEMTLPEAKGELRQRAKQEAVARIRAEPIPVPEGRFRVIVVDPPWRYDVRAEDATHRGRVPYPDMSLDEIAALPVKKLAHEDCVLWLWTTNAFTGEAHSLLAGWGFAVKTILTWVKPNFGLGVWLRNQTEHVLLAVRGHPKVTLTTQSSVLYGQSREHSRKPEEFYALVESLCPGSKLEMFARQRREGWVAHGNETGTFTTGGGTTP